MAMAGVFYLCTTCFCMFMIVIPIFLWLISSVFSIFSFDFFANVFYVYWWIIKHFVKSFLPTIILFSTSCYFIFEFVKKLEIHNSARKKINEQNKTLQLSDFTSAMREMRQTVIYIVFFFIALEIGNYFVFSNNLVYKVIFYLNISLIMSLVLGMLVEEGTLMEATGGRNRTARQARTFIDFLAVLMGSVLVGEMGRLLFGLLMG